MKGISVLSPKGVLFKENVVQSFTAELIKNLSKFAGI
ncbi:hypothetical protein ABES03_11450 [Neobacillus rhizosphaerae]